MLFCRAACYAQAVSDARGDITDAPAEPAPGRTGAGRGVLYIAFAKFYFMFAGLVIQFRLPAVLSRAAFGSYSLVANIASLVNNVLVTGTIQTVSRFAAQEPGKARRVQQAGLRMHVRLGLVIAVGFIAAVTDDLTANVHAGKLVGVVAEAAGGKGGGKPNMARAGGKDPAKIAEALAKGLEWARDQLAK